MYFLYFLHSSLPSLVIYSPFTRPSFILHSSFTHPSLILHSPFTYPSLTLHSSFTHPSLILHYLSLIFHSSFTHPSLTLHSSSPFLPLHLLHPFTSFALYLLFNDVIGRIGSSPYLSWSFFKACFKMGRQKQVPKMARIIKYVLVFFKNSSWSDQFIASRTDLANDKNAVKNFKLNIYNFCNRFVRYICCIDS